MSLVVEPQGPASVALSPVAEHAYHVRCCRYVVDSPHSHMSEKVPEVCSIVSQKTSSSNIFTE
jgi:hypothetical protein